MPDIPPTAPPPQPAVQLPDDRQLVLRVMPMPADANANGDIFGGWIMAQVDIAGALPAALAAARDRQPPNCSLT